MLQQMMTDDRDEDVREAVVKSLGLLMGFICDADKYSQVCTLTFLISHEPVYLNFSELTQVAPPC